MLLAWVRRETESPRNTSGAFHGPIAFTAVGHVGQDWRGAVLNYRAFPSKERLPLRSPWEVGWNRMKGPDAHCRKGNGGRSLNSLGPRGHRGTSQLTILFPSHLGMGTQGTARL